ncbi:hypothetical protein ACIRNY_02825 [Capnocytophaga canimorsus]|uniref:hypothetical protein n=1 Tax=Capnocytophaga canimorsus TaxID=28188 RepID=UPI001ACFAF82|nr:hypothetical protein [Capnocytophaga canimorsus]GIM57723.1 hypothetical protein CAPN006_21150 [Capnocytophaga canimorsus]
MRKKITILLVIPFLLFVLGVLWDYIKTPKDMEIILKEDDYTDCVINYKDNFESVKLMNNHINSEIEYALKVNDSIDKKLIKRNRISWSYSQIFEYCDFCQGKMLVNYKIDNQNFNVEKIEIPNREIDNSLKISVESKDYNNCILVINIEKKDFNLSSFKTLLTIISEFDLHKNEENFHYFVKSKNNKDLFHFNFVKNGRFFKVY